MICQENLMRKPALASYFILIESFLRKKYELICTKYQNSKRLIIYVYSISAKQILPDTFDELFFPTPSNISVIQLVVDFGHCTNLASFRKSLQGEQV